MKKIILDASVALKWFYPEKLGAEARQVRDAIQKKEIQAIVPRYFFVEFANASWVKYQREKASLIQVLTSFDQMKTFPFGRHAYEEYDDIALENAVKYNVSVYDAMYLSLAEIYFAPVITADYKLYKACKDDFELIEYLGKLAI